nr:glycosyltransferase [Mucilaginibacter sp. L294]
MRVLHIIAAYKPAYIYGGPTMSVAMLCEELTKANVHTEVFTTTANGPSELPVGPNTPQLIDGVTVTYFKRITKDHTHLSPALLNAVRNRAKEFDVIHIHAWWNLVSVFACLLALVKNIPVIVSPRGTLSPYSFSNKNIGKKGLIHNLLGKRLLQKCHIHATSQRESDAIHQLLKPVSVTTIPNFVKLPVTIPNTTQPATDILNLIFFSRIEEKKGLDILLESLKLITVPFKLTIAGNGHQAYIDHLKAQLTDWEIAAKVIWAGFYNDDKFDLLGSQDLFILPSYDENFGNAVIESLSVGTPVLISENVGLADYVAENKLGWICQTTAGSISNAINAIGNNRPALLYIRKNAPGIIRQHFSADKLVQRYIHFYQQVTTNSVLPLESNDH